MQAFDASSGNSSTLGDGQIIKELLGGTQDTARSGNAEGGILNSILRSEVPISVNDKGPLMQVIYCSSGSIAKLELHCSSAHLQFDQGIMMICGTANVCR